MFDMSNLDHIFLSNRISEIGLVLLNEFQQNTVQKLTKKPHDLNAQ